MNLDLLSRDSRASVYLPPVCSVPNCWRERYSRMYCARHHDRHLRTGDVQADTPLVGKTYTDGLPRGFRSDVPLTEPLGFFGAVILCDKCPVQLGPVHDAETADSIARAHLARCHA